MDKRGFTFTEILVSMALLSILLASSSSLFVALAQQGKRIEKRRDMEELCSSVLSQVASLSAADLHALYFGTSPTPTPRPEFGQWPFWDHQPNSPQRWIEYVDQQSQDPNQGTNNAPNPTNWLHEWESLSGATKIGFMIELSRPNVVTPDLTDIEVMGPQLPANAAALSEYDRLARARVQFKRTAQSPVEEITCQQRSARRRGCFGDGNGDGVVNAADLSVLLSTFGQSVLPGSDGDYNRDGIVNGADLSILLSRFGTGC
jgi:prepilin-type N-terminal cleavage/methylation domain-containing protein